METLDGFLMLVGKSPYLVRPEPMLTYMQSSSRSSSRTQAIHAYLGSSSSNSQRNDDGSQPNVLKPSSNIHKILQSSTENNASRRSSMYTS